MGKKSKKNAAAKSAGSAAPASTALVPAGTKKQRCDGCCSLLKDIANIKPCPGCSSLFCWRCEKKIFLGCPNADLCPSPSRRCPKCATGRTMLRNLATVRIMPLDCFTEKDGTPLLKKLLVPDLLESFKMLVRQHQEDLTVSATPLLLCGAKDCSKSFGCGSCVDCSGVFHFCSRCDKHRCVDCADCFQNLSPREKAELIFLMLSAAVLSDSFEKYKEKHGVSIGWTDGMACCATCNRTSCFECLDMKEAKRMMKSLLAQAVGSPSYMYFHCDPCYWSSKSCTNPTCPNPVGSVPTMRCSGCHIDRYCSVECQAAAYPQHMDRCRKIGEKLISSGKYVADERGCHKVQTKSSDDDDSSGFGGDGDTSDGSDESS